MLFCAALYWSAVHADRFGAYTRDLVYIYLCPPVQSNDSTAYQAGLPLSTTWLTHHHSHTTHCRPRLRLGPTHSPLASVDSSATTSSPSVGSDLLRRVQTRYARGTHTHVVHVARKPYTPTPIHTNPHTPCAGQRDSHWPHRSPVLHVHRLWPPPPPASPYYQTVAT